MTNERKSITIEDGVKLGIGIFIVLPVINIGFLLIVLMVFGLAL